MGELRKKMLRRMELKKLSAKTIKLYLWHMEKFVKYYYDNQSKEINLEPVEFIRRFMLHILPEGFFKIRYYGILSNRRKKWTLERCREVIAKLKLERSGNPDASGNKTVNHERTYEQWIWRCPKCEKGIMNVVALVIGKTPG